MAQIFEALLRTPFDGPWMSFRHPVTVLTARRAAEVRPCLLEAETSATRGAYVVGFLAYEAAQAFGLPTQAQAKGLPLACFGVFDPADVHRTELERPAVSAVHDPEHWTPSIDRASYTASLRRIKEYIADGHTYQLNFTFRLRAGFESDPRRLFDALTAAQAGAWSVYIDLGTHVIASASPELFFIMAGGQIECRPMKGTAPRGLSVEDDYARAEALRTSPKNRSENVMILDLMRNDLGRIARTGSVSPGSLFDVEQYPRQWHMTSTVRADVSGVPLSDVMAALFPSGSVTGAPKHRSMEIIRELETSPRGLYTGSIGMIDPHGRAHFNVAIRSVVIDRATAEAEFGVGSGIVWESTDSDEYDECQSKAAILTSRQPNFDLLETMKWDPDRGFELLERHLARLCASARYFAFAHDVGSMRKTLEQAVANRHAAGRVRLLVGRSGETRCEVGDLDAPPSQPWRVALAGHPVSNDDLFLYHKTTNREAYERARASRADADAVLLWNESGEVTEATEANLVLEIDGRLVTPPVASGLLPGTFRAELLERGEISERRVTVADLNRSTRIWLINSVRGWMPAIVI